MYVCMYVCMYVYIYIYIYIYKVDPAYLVEDLTNKYCFFRPQRQARSAELGRQLLPMGAF